MKTINSKPDGTLIELNDDGSWDLTRPNGTHVRGQAANADAATQAANAAYEQWIVATWQRGNLDLGQTWRAPID